MTSYNAHRTRYLLPSYYSEWQSTSDANLAADEIIVAPERHLLTAHQVFQAEGGYNGLVLQTLTTLLGVGSVFAMSPRMASYWRSGSMKWMEWSCLGGAAFLFYTLGLNLSIQQMGDPAKLRNHYTAYSLVKAQNRWEGRQILKKPPMMY